MPFTFPFTDRINFSRFASYSSGITCPSGIAGLSNCLHTSLMPMQIETQSGFKETTSESKRCSRSLLVLPETPELVTRRYTSGYQVLSMFSMIRT